MPANSRLKKWFRRVGEKLRVGRKASVKVWPAGTPVTGASGLATTTSLIDTIPAARTPANASDPAPAWHIDAPRSIGTTVKNALKKATSSRTESRLCNFLRDRGYDPSKSVDLNWALGRACYLGHEDVVSQLLAYRVSPLEASNFTTRFLQSGSKPLHIAVHAKRRAIIKLLLAEHGADPNVRDEVGRTPLHYASSEDIARLLLQHGAAIDACDISGETPLHTAVKDGRYTAVEVLLDNGANPNNCSASGETPLWLVRLGDLWTLDRLIRGGADINARDVRGQSLLHKASRRGTGDFVLGLLDRGADLEARDADGQTPLFGAVLGARHGVARKLVDRGAAINVCDAHGSTPLQLAQARNMWYMLSILRRSSLPETAPWLVGPTPLRKSGGGFSGPYLTDLSSPWIL
ncbi:ankyrin repeat-containing domain protein [Achaetomium macrosporum]|uniref:Ankyrin repeat-containing domain protein n=1 Tax=Achaetomium macrosporum TaxID=79813 RepID=A0AAN7H749_9PEZI|nr:ankyrin repeat-containing domain protein [Achaetomium macrosporum]